MCRGWSAAAHSFSGPGYWEEDCHVCAITKASRLNFGGITVRTTRYKLCPVNTLVPIPSPPYTSSRNRLRKKWAVILDTSTVACMGVGHSRAQMSKIGSVVMERADSVQKSVFAIPRHLADTMPISGQAVTAVHVSLPHQPPAHRVL